MAKSKIIFIKYDELDKEFYTIKEVQDMLNLDKSFLESACEEFNVHPKQNRYGEWGFSIAALTYLHYKMFYEYNDHRTRKANNGPWDN